MTTKDEALKQALDALKLGAAMYSPAGTAHAQIAASIAACREALAQKDEQEPVAIGTEWTPCLKLPIVVHVREQREGESHVSTREGITPVKHDDLIMRGVAGEEYPIGRAVFDRTYTFTVYKHQERKPLTDEKLRAMWVNYAPIVGGVLEFARAIEAAHGIEVEHDAQP